MTRLKLYLLNSYTLPGYTLIEILIAITIIALLFLTGFASYREYSRRQELVSAVRSIRGDLRQAQEMAIASKKPSACAAADALDGYRFVVIPPGSYQILWLCGGSTTGVEKSVALPSGITISGLSPNLTPSNTILFKTLGQGTNIPTGDPPGSGSTIITVIQSDLGQSADITITTGGEIK
jgi:prepilin-type N-terminal cleavage/methylation domain-containing protein